MKNQQILNIYAYYLHIFKDFGLKSYKQILSALFTRLFKAYLTNS